MDTSDLRESDYLESWLSLLEIAEDGDVLNGQEIKKLQNKIAFEKMRWPLEDFNLDSFCLELEQKGYSKLEQCLISKQVAIKMLLWAVLFERSSFKVSKLQRVFTYYWILFSKKEYNAFEYEYPVRFEPWAKDYNFYLYEDVEAFAKNFRGWCFLDLALPKFKVAIECDGPDHDEADDCFRDNQLAKLGWKVFRVKNEEIEKSPRFAVLSVQQRIDEYLGKSIIN